MKKTDILNISKAIALGLILSVGVGYLSAAWTEPSVAPTGGNTDAPLNIGAGTQTKGTTTAGQSGSLVLTGGLSTNLFKLTDGNQATDKVLASDVNGLGSWKSLSELSGGGTSSGPYCTIVDTSSPAGSTYPGDYRVGQEVQGNFKVSLLRNGSNMCTDSNNCSFRIWAATDSLPEGKYFFNQSPLMYRQISGGRWVESRLDINGINGDNTNTNLSPTSESSEWHGGKLMDDGGSVEQSADLWTFVDNTSNYSFVIQVCDF